MSRELISSAEFPPKPHNCKSFNWQTKVHWLTCLGPAVKVPGLVFVAGQTSADPDIKKATRTVLENLKKVLELAGSSMEQVVKYNGECNLFFSKRWKGERWQVATVYLADMKDFAAMNEVYIDFLPPNPPSRTCIAAAALPGAGTIVEIECIAQA